MDTKVVIFVLIAAVLIAAIYSSTSSIAFARGVRCSTHAKTGDTTCISGDNKLVTYCWHDPKTGRVAGCINIYRENIPVKDLAEALGSATFENKPDENLQKALDAAIQETQNNTKSPNTDILKDNTTLQQNNDDGKEPKAPKVPEDLGGLNNNNSG
jgi:hypothetical protein